MRLENQTRLSSFRGVLILRPTTAGRPRAVTCICIYMYIYIYSSHTRANLNLHSVAACVPESTGRQIFGFRKGSKANPPPSLPRKHRGMFPLKKIIDRFAAVRALHSRECRRASAGGIEFSRKYRGHSYRHV